MTEDRVVRSYRSGDEKEKRFCSTWELCFAPLPLLLGELSHFVHFYPKRRKVSGVNSSLTHQGSPIPNGGLKIPILMTFEHENVEIVARMRSLLECYSYEEYIQEES